MRHTVNVFIIAMSIAVPAMAQDFAPAAAEQQRPTAAAAPVATGQGQAQGGMGRAAMAAPAAGQRSATPQAAPAAPTPATYRPDSGIDQTDVNIKLTITVTDKNGSSPQTKVATMMLANMGSGKLRSSNQATAVLNADAYAELRKSGLVKLSITVGYNPESDSQTPRFDVQQTVSLFLKDNVPTIVTQAADPTKNGRSVTIEVTASVMK